MGWRQRLRLRHGWIAVGVLSVVAAACGPTPEPASPAVPVVFATPGTSTYVVPPGKPLKVWEGITGSQELRDTAGHAVSAGAAGKPDSGANEAKSR